MDRISKKQRSENMAAVSAKGNKTTEVPLLKLLQKNKIVGWRRHVKNVFGKPDFVFRQNMVAVFVDGCFWHGCKLHRSLPATNKKFWKEKIIKNKIRDKKVNYQLKKTGWKVLRFWEHKIKKNRAECVEKIITALKQTSAHQK